MYYQNENGFLPEIQEIGCFFISCINCVEKATGVKLTKSEVNTLWNDCKERGYINKNNDIVSSQNIMNYLLTMKGSHLRFTEVATKRYGVLEWYKSIPNTWKEKPYQLYYIQKVRTEKGNTHFILVDKKEDVILDPFKTGVKVTDIFYTIVYYLQGGYNG